jgi:hypothetical protein
MQLNAQNKEQAAWEIVRSVVKQVESTLRNYNRRAGCKKLSLDDVREHFLKYSIMSGDPGRRTLATTFNSFFFEWDYRSRLIELSDLGSREPFFTHLFRGC